MTPRRVLMLVAGDIAHDARVRRSARSLAANGYDVTVACGTAPDAPPRTGDEDGYRVVHTPVVITEEAEVRLRTEFRTDHRKAASHLDRPYRAAWSDIVRNPPPAVVHVHDYHGLATAVKAARPRTRVVYDAHEHVLGKISDAGRRRAFELYLRRHAPRADAVITVGKQIGAMLMRDLRLPKRPLVVHNAPPLRNGRRPLYDLRAVAGVDRSTPLLVYSGSVSKRRDVETPIAALRALPDVELAFVLANGRFVSELADAAERLGVRERVHFLPPVAPEGVVALLRDGDIGLVPLKPHGNGDVAMPNKLFEYLHAGLPMVVSDSPSVASFVRKWRLGEVAPAGDVDAWADAIRRVLAGRGRARPADRAALCREWSWEAQEAKLVKLYGRLVGMGEEVWYDRVYETSAKYRADYTDSDYYPSWRAVAERLRALGARSVLDIGCGPGQFAALARDAGVPRYLGLDFSGVAVKRARKVCSEFEFRVADALTSDILETHPYDAVVCLETLEHIERDTDVVRRLRPGTRFVGTVPDFDAAGHVRFFASEDEVRERYAGVLRDLNVATIGLGGPRLFLFEGVTVG